MKHQPVRLAVSVALILAATLASHARADQPITAAEATALATKIEDSIRNGDGSVFQNRFDDSAMLDIAAKGLSLTPDQRAGSLAGYTVGKELAGVIVDAVKQGGTYHFLHLLQVAGAQQPLFRLVRADGGVNYHQLTLARGADGTVRIVDVYVYATGEEITDTVHRQLVAAVASENRNALQKLIGSDNDYVKHLADVDRYQKATHEGDTKTALAIYDQFPDGLKHDKMMMILRVSNTSGGDPAAYAAAMSDFEKTFPGDPALLLMGVDAFFMKKDYNGVFRELDALDKSLAGDPYLDFLRASARIAQGRDADAAELCHSAAVREPDLESAWEACVTERLKIGDYAKVVDVLNESEQKGGLRWTGINNSPAFADFVKSKEYAQWVKTHPQDPATQPAQ